jgi:L-gulonate 3-dehydrogenase
MIAVVGAGSIGVGLAVVFARGGHTVALHDPDPARLEAALEETRSCARMLREWGLLDERALRIEAVGDRAEAVAGADHVQECAPERLELKRELLAALDAEAPSAATIASSSSALSCSEIAAGLEHRHRHLVAHPANPPHLLPVIELVPGPFTDRDALARVATLLRGCGMSPVTVEHEPEGFVYNRLQGALLREAYCLVRDGVIGVDELDRIVREGLGRRWAVVGPFETADLNTRGGIAAHAEKLGPAYARMGAERGQHDPWTPELVARVSRERRERLALEEWAERVAWRDRRLAAAERARRDDAD